MAEAQVPSAATQGQTKPARRLIESGALLLCLLVAVRVGVLLLQSQQLPDIWRPSAATTETNAPAIQQPAAEGERELLPSLELDAGEYVERCVTLSEGHLEADFAQKDACWSRKQVQQILIDLVLDTSTVFSQHRISHFLDSGTLLGAYRHGSVIPFDQDADLGIDALGFATIKVTPIQLAPAYALHVFDSELYANGTRCKELPVRVIHRDSGLYLDVFVYEDSDQPSGRKMTGPLPSGCFVNCRECPMVERGKWEFKVPFEWIYPLRPCLFAGRELRCPRQPTLYLRYMFGDDFMEPLAYP